MNAKTTRREFLGTAAMAAGGMLGGCATGGLAGSAKLPNFAWGALLHLGSNMWDDFDTGPDDWAKSEEEEKLRPNPYGPSGKRRSGYHCYLRCRDDLWRKATDHAAEKRLNLVFIDLGEGMAFPSHPELAVAGTWSVEKVQKELARLRAMGLEPIPKLNFSTCHDSWLKMYHRMVSTPRYYQVVADVIRDTCEIFGHPRLFHIGYDEEMPIAAFNSFYAVCRQGELWWHDLFYTIGQVEKNGARAVMWSDAIWTGREEYLRRMSKGVLQTNWYYRSDFSAKKLKWNSEFEKKGGWGETVNGAAAFMELEKAGFDQMPCTSNWAEDAAADALVAYCKEHIDPSRLKGFYTAPWAMTVPDTEKKKGITKVIEGIDLFAAARDRHYPGA